MTTSIINCNKLMGDLFGYHDFEIALDTILLGSGIEQYRIIRADLRLDSYDPEHYEAFQKLNRYLISAMALAYPSVNCYRSTNLFSEKLLSIAIKNRDLELESYDKAAESGGRDLAMARLEERSKARPDTSIDIPTEFLEHWRLRWQKAFSCLDAVQDRYNEELLARCQSGKNAYPCKWRSLTDFLLQNEQSIFTRKQLIDLLSRIPEVGPEKAKNRAENHKKRYGLEFFSKSDVQFAIDEIQRATEAFFAS